MILWTLVILLMLGFAVTQTQQTGQEQTQSAEPPTSGDELKTDGWAWTQAHAGIDNPATLVGGPLQVQVNNVPGQDSAFWIFPGPRELDPHVFGTPDKPLGYAPPISSLWRAARPEGRKRGWQLLHADYSTHLL